MNFRIGSVLVFWCCLEGGFLDLNAQESSPPPAPTITNSSETATPALASSTLDEAGLLRLLTDRLQTDCVKDSGTLELRLARPWQSLTISNEPLSLKILSMPTAGIAPQFIAKFELLTSTRSLGVWQAVLQAKVWREINVARVALVRGRVLDPADVALERRDVLPLRGDLAELASGDTRQELTENLPAGAPLTARSLKVRAVVHRGQTADAVMADGVMQITMKVEVLEDGIPGQTVRLRNFQSRRELRGIVQNEKRIIIPL